MLIEINGKTYETTKEQDASFIEYGLTFTDKIVAGIAEHIRFLMKNVARAMLLKFELDYPSLREIIRPRDKKADPVHHLLSLGTLVLPQQLANARISIITNERDNSINSISFKFPTPGESRG